MTHSLTFGSLLLTDPLADVDHGFMFAVLADGFTTGTGEPVKEIVQSLLADGDLVRITRSGNREVSFRVQITGPTLGAVAQGEAALRREVGRGNTLTWQPPDVISEPTVFEVVTSEMSQVFDDLDESLRRQRTFALTLTCFPGARSADLTTVTALAPPPVAPTTVSVTTADTTTGWSATVNTGAGSEAVTVVDEGAFVSASATGFSMSFGYSPPSPVSLAGTQYLLLETSTATTGFYVFYAGDSAVTYVKPVLSRMMPTSGNVQHTLPVNMSRTLSYVGVIWNHLDAGLPAPTPIYLTIYDIKRTDTLPQVTSRQTSRIIEVGGTERTPGSIEIATGSTAMGFTIVHTSPRSLAGYSPPLRQFRVSGNTLTADSNLFSGAREPVNLTAIESQVPLTSLPAGEYALVALMRSSVAGTFPITWTANSLIPGYGYLGPTVSGVAQAEFVDPGFWTLVPLDVVTLPTVRASDALAVTQLTLNRAPVGSEVIDLDEWWAFRVGEDSALTMVNNPASRLWLDSPDVNNRVPRVSIGDYNNRADARHPADRLSATAHHVLNPDGTLIFVATNGADSPAVTATFFKRWHSNAAE